MTARNKVLLLERIEHMERIFAWLPMDDLLLASRVCIRWRIIIARPPILQQVLFLHTLGEDQAWFHPDLAWDGSGILSLSENTPEPQIQLIRNP